MADLGKAIAEKIIKRDSGAMVRFLRDLIAIPSVSGQEGPAAARAVKEMKKCGFSRAFVDQIGNAVGIIGSGKPVVLLDAHLDTVGTHDAKQWKVDPFRGKVDSKYVHGRGAAENKGAFAAIVYGVKAMQEAGLLTGTVIVTGSAYEEDCDGLGLQHALTKTGLKPEAVVVGKFTGLQLTRGQRGRMEIRITVPGKSCHASTPDEGINPIYRALPLIAGIEKLNKRLKKDAFLGKGTVAVTQIKVTSPGFNRLAHEVVLSVDRRLTVGETKELALRQLRSLPGAKGAKVEVLNYEGTASTGLKIRAEKYFPGWSVKENSRVIKAAAAAYKRAFGRKPEVGKWTVSSNGVASCGLLGIPTVGFGPGEKRFLHNYEDRIAIADLEAAALLYAMFPQAWRAAR